MHAFVAFWVYGAVLVGAVGCGFAVVPPGVLDRFDAALALASVLGIGLISLVVLVLIAGYVDALRSPLLAVVGCVGIGGLVARRAAVAALVSRVRRALAAVRGGERVCLAVLVVCVAAAYVAGLKHPFAVDERGYHWAAPVFWADHHHWVRSPFILTNGPAFMEWLYTLPGLTGSYEAAHWLHATTLVVLVLSVASIARSLGVGWVLPATGVASIPVALKEAALAYNDVAAAAFVVLAVAIALAPRRSTATFWLAGCSLAAAASIKLFMLAGIPALVVAVELSPRRLTRAELRGVALGLVGLPALVIALLSARTYALTRHLTDLGSQHVAHYGSPNWPYAPGYYPDARHTLLLPVEPFFTGVFGTAEPWGGRTGVVLLLALPVAVVVAVARRRIDRRALVVLGAGCTFLVLVGLVTPRTRYLLPAYVLLVVFALMLLQQELRGRARGFLPLAVAAAATLDLLDTVHVYAHGL